MATRHPNGTNDQYGRTNYRQTERRAPQNKNQKCYEYYGVGPSDQAEFIVNNNYRSKDPLQGHR